MLRSRSAGHSMPIRSISAACFASNPGLLCNSSCVFVDRHALTWQRPSLPSCTPTCIRQAQTARRRWHSHTLPTARASACKTCMHRNHSRPSPGHGGEGLETSARFSGLNLYLMKYRLPFLLRCSPPCRKPPRYSGVFPRIRVRCWLSSSTGTV